MSSRATNNPIESFFQFIVDRPKSVVIVSLILMAMTLSLLPKLVKDTRADAFLAPDNPALVYRDKVKEQFGLSDPLVVAVVNTGPNGIFNPDSLALVQWLSDEISLLDNIDSDRIVGLPTENNIEGTESGMEVNPFFDPLPDTQIKADLLRDSINDFPLYLGSIVARDGSATMIVAEMVDEGLAEETYQQFIDLVDRAPTLQGEDIHVAGEGAIAGFLGSYIDADAQRLNPLAGLIITLIIIFAFRRFSPALMSNVIIAAAVLMTLGIMAGSGIAFFVITNALPVILIGIAVADAIHIYSHYFDLQMLLPHEDKKKLIVATMSDMWRPVTLTTLTTMAGFLGLYFAAYMPPFKYFGLFTAVGVFIAGVYSLVFLPAAMALSKPNVSKHILQKHQSNKPELLSQIMIVIGRITLANSRTIITLFVFIILAGLYAASQLQVDENRIATFDPDERIYLADKAINQHFDGTYNLDIVVETPAAEDLFIPANLRKMEALQSYAESLPRVQGSTSIVDFLKQMNRALNEGDVSEYRLPDSKELIAQYFLIYSASSDPTDFEEEIDYDYQTAIIRININSGRYQDAKEIIESLDDYIEAEFNTENIQATLSGRVNLNYHWIKDLGRSHFAGLSLSLFLVWAVSALLFRSTLAGLFALIPVVGSILLVYSAMVMKGIALGIGTSMFASVAIGLGVDFAIHTIDRLKKLYAKFSGDLDKALEAFYPTTGRALLLNFLAISCGFGVLISSKVVPLNNFGIIVVLAVSTSFIASMTLLPAMLKVFKPTFLFLDEEKQTSQSDGSIQRSSGESLGRVVGIISAVALTGYLIVQSEFVAADTSAQTSDGNITAEEIVQRINEMDEGEFVTRKLDMFMTDRRGRERVRETFGYRKYFGEEKRTILFYQKPTSVKGTGFMTWDYPDPEVDDDQWLYLPAMRKVRRISASDRGDYFLGTDLTYQDIKLEGKLERADYDYVLMGRELLDGIETYKLSSKPKTEVIAKELGYGRTEMWVDSSNWQVIKTDFWDVKDRPLKSLTVSDVRKVHGIWTRHEFHVVNHKTGHQTRFIFSEVDYKTPVDDAVFSQRALSRGR